MPALPSLLPLAQTETENVVAASMSDFSTVPFHLTLANKDHVGVGGYKKQMFVGEGGYKKQMFVGDGGYKKPNLLKQHDCKIGGEQKSVGVGGVQSSVGAGVGAGVRGNGDKASRHGGMVARF